MFLLESLAHFSVAVSDFPNMYINEPTAATNATTPAIIKPTGFIFIIRFNAFWAIVSLPVAAVWTVVAVVWVAVATTSAFLTNTDFHCSSVVLIRALVCFLPPSSISLDRASSRPIIIWIKAVDFFCISFKASDSEPNNVIAPVIAENEPTTPWANLTHPVSISPGSSIFFFILVSLMSLRNWPMLASRALNLTWSPAFPAASIWLVKSFNSARICLTDLRSLSTDIFTFTCSVVVAIIFYFLNWDNHSISKLYVTHT